MKIRQKIAFIYTIITCVILLSAFSFAYYLSASFTERNFYLRLEEKASFTAWKYFEEDELSGDAYRLVIEKYIQNLPDAHEIVLNTSNIQYVKDSLSKIIPTHLINRVLSHDLIKFRKGDRQGVGLYYPDNQGNFIIIITAIDKYGVLKQRHLLEVLIGIFFVSIVFVFLMGEFYAQRVLSPLVSIMRNVRKINATNLSLRLEEKSGNDELTELTRMFNQMLERLEDSFALQKNFIHNASHELKNPITAILGETEVALNKQRSVAEYIATLNVVMGESERLEQLTRNLLVLAQADVDLSSMTLQEIHLDDLVIEIKESLDKTLYKSRIHVKISKPLHEKGLRISGIQNLLYSAIFNLLDNACKFSGNKQVELSLKDTKEFILLTIKDKGIGIPDAEIKNLYQPFFRASNAMSIKGSGIGLSLVKKIIGLHNGSIKVKSNVGVGTFVEINLPILKNS